MAVVPLSARSYTALRVLAVVIPIALAMGGTAAVFFAVPQVNDAFETCLTGKWGICVPMVGDTSVMFDGGSHHVLVGRILWSASEPPIASDGDMGSADLT